MVSKSFQPTWWNETEHGGAWQRAREAMRRELERAERERKKEAKADKNDDDNNGGVKPRPFGEIESPMSYGYAAFMQYGSKYPYWDPTLESTLRDEWSAGEQDEDWDEVAPFVRQGFDAPHSK